MLTANIREIYLHLDQIVKNDDKVVVDFVSTMSIALLGTES